jgi:hypothetical protein
MTLIPILIPWDGEITLIWRGELKLTEILLHILMDRTIKHIRNPTISFSSHHPTLVLPTSNSN